MVARPIVGVIACNRPIGEEIAQAVINRYLTATMRHADCVALIIPALPDLMQAREIVNRLDGILLTGSPSNVAPSRYGDSAKGTGPFDLLRDHMAMDLVSACLDQAKPLFGICRGFQEINVALGGSLRRDMSAPNAQLPHHAPPDVSFAAQFDHRHAVEIQRGGWLETIYPAGPMQVNSVHYQGIDRLAEGLRIEALAPDGVVEAYSGTPHGAPLLAVQWHPEWAADDDADSAAYFKLMGQALRGDL